MQVGRFSAKSGVNRTVNSQLPGLLFMLHRDGSPPLDRARIRLSVTTSKRRARSCSVTSQGEILLINWIRHLGAAGKECRCRRVVLALGAGRVDPGQRLRR